MESCDEAGTSSMFAGDSGVRCDFAVVCVTSLKVRTVSALRLTGDCEGAPAGEVAGAGLVAVDFAEAFAQAFAGFVHLGF